MSRLRPPRGCVWCPVLLQPLEPSTTYAQQAWALATAAGVALPAHGPAALPWLAFVAHWSTCHQDTGSLRDYVEEVVHY